MAKFRIPYGISSFEKLMTQNYYFIDKTKYIETIEKFHSPYLTFLRPRNFGKTLLIKMLEYYYDINHADKFDKLFSNSYIGKNPTPEKNNYHILTLDFSKIRIKPNIDETEKEFQLYIVEKIMQFLHKYNIEVDFSYEYLRNLSANMILEKLVDLRKDFDLRIYLLIDEYDNFLNEVLMNYDEYNYRSITHGDGFIRSFFKKIKAMTKNNTINRIFITGVSHLAMNDVTSGYNIGDNISVNPLFSEMVGINEDELEQIIDYFVDEKDKEIVLQDLEKWYNGYSFNLYNINKKVYNTSLVWFYLKNYLINKKPTREKSDSNLMSDFGKLKYLIYVDKKQNGNFSMLKEVLEKRIIKAQFKRDFYLEKFIEPLDSDNFTSLLFYLGLLTIKSKLGSSFHFTIPNLVTEELFWSYIRKALKLQYRELQIDVKYLREEYEKMVLKGAWEGVFKYILDKFYQIASIRDFIFKKEVAKMFFLTYIQMSDFYIIRSESEQKQGFADIYLEPKFPEVKYRYLIEFKYINKHNRRDVLQDVSPRTDIQQDVSPFINKAKERAKQQLKKYRQQIQGTDYKSIVILVRNQKLILMEVLKL